MTLPRISQDTWTQDALRFLAQAGSALGASLDYEATLATVARLVVPTLADWCMVDIADADGTLRRLAVTHVDPAREAWGRELVRRYPPDPDAPNGTLHVFRTGESELLEEIPDATLAAVASDAEHLRLLQRLGLRSYIGVPLIARGRTLGVLSLLMADSGWHYGPADLALAEDLAHRAAIAVDNARLHRNEQAARIEAERAAERTARLQTVTAALSRALTVDQVAETIVAEGVAVLHARSGVLVRTLPAGDALEIVSAVGYPAPVVEAFRRIDLWAELPIAEAVRTAEPIFLESRAIWAERFPTLVGVRAGLASGAVLATPLAVEGRVLGGFALVFDEDRRFDGGDRAFVATLAAQCAQAFERARLYEAEREARARAEREVAERLRTEEQLRTWADAFEHSAHGLTISDPATGTLRTVNPAFATMHGFAVDELVGRAITEVYAPGVRAEVPSFGARADRTGHASFESRHVRKDGTEFPVLVDVTTVCDADGTPRYRIVNVQDISERRRLTDQLEQAQKLEAIGRLAGGIAHDFNNLLTAVTGYATLALRTIPPDLAARSDVEEIRRTAERAAALTAQLLAFSRQQLLQPTILDVNEVLTDVAKLLRQLLGSDIDLAVRPDPALRRVEADRHQLEQVIVNLAVNARDAMPSGGHLTLETRNVELGEDYASRHVGVTAGSYVLLAVSDTGTGMGAETRMRIFEPFYTTKEQGKGTGLGLAQVFGVVKQSGGHIAVYSEPGLGATFKIYLPCATVGEPDTAASAAPPPVPGGAETVLLAEDEPLVRVLAGRTLREQGYTVLEAERGSEALRLAAEHDGPIHLLLTDLVMPGMSGRELDAELRRTRPSIRTLYISGYADDAVVRQGMLQATTDFMQKPFTPDRLARRVRDVLDSPVPEHP